MLLESGKSSSKGTELLEVVEAVPLQTARTATSPPNLLLPVHTINLHSASESDRADSNFNSVLAAPPPLGEPHPLSATVGGRSRSQSA